MTRDVLNTEDRSVSERLRVLEADRDNLMTWAARHTELINAIKAALEAHLA